MRTKPDLLIKRLSKKLDIPESIISVVVGDYYQTLKDELVKVDHSDIFVPSLGTFSLKPVVTKDYVKKYIILKERYKDSDDVKGKMRYQSYSNKLERIQKAKALLDLEKVRREKFKNENI